MTPMREPQPSYPSGLGWPGDVSRETLLGESEPGLPSGLGWPVSVATEQGNRG